MREVESGFPSPAEGDGGALLVRYGPTLWVRIGFDGGYQRGSGAIPNLPEADHPALVDTGATLSCIDSALAALLHLPIVDREPVSGVHGSEEVNIHLGQIYVPSLGEVILGRFHGVHLAMGNQVHRAILGRTFLRDLKMVYDGPAASVVISKE